MIRRISLGPGDTAGYFSRLKSGFDQLGIPSEHFLLSSNKFSYHETNHFLKDFFHLITPLSKNKYPLVRHFSKILINITKAVILLYAILRCDIFIFSGFQTFFDFRELHLLKILKKKVIVVYFGSDARPPIFSGRHLDDLGNYVEPIAAFAEAMYMKRRIRTVERHADIIVNHTATAQFFSRSFIRFHAIGMPIKIDPPCKSLDIKSSPAVRILHAPSRPLAKGTKIFRKIIDQLRLEGYKIDFIELTNVPNSIVLSELHKCDFLLDELYSDVPLAMLATEAAMLHKPAIVGGYYAKDYLGDNPDSHLPPSCFVEPDKIKATIKKMIDMHSMRIDLGERSYKFVANQWSAEIVAKKFICIIRNEIPESWIGKPKELGYYWGFGLSKDMWAEQLKKYLSVLGDGALLLEHNKELKDKVLSEILIRDFRV
jgi:hypothetical protein